MAKTATQYKPHPFQDVFHKCNARFRSLRAGRRSGKSEAGALESAYWLDTGRTVCCNQLVAKAMKDGELVRWCPKCEKYITNPEREIRPVEGLVVAPTYQDLKDVNAPLIRKYIPQEYIAKWNTVEMRMELTNGATLSFISADKPSSIGHGRKFDFIWLDEGRDYKDFRLLWETLLPTLTDYGGFAWSTSTTHGRDASWKVFDNMAAHVWRTEDPLGEYRQEPYYEFKEGLDQDFALITFRSVDNPYIPMEEVLENKARMSPQMYRQEYFATLEQFSGMIYPMFDEKVHVIDALPEEVEGLIYFVGVDTGLTNPTAILLMAEDIDHNLYVMDEWYKSKQLAPDIAAAITEMTKGYEIANILIDPASGGTHQSSLSGMSVKDQIMELGINLEDGINDVRAGIDRVAQMLRPQGIANKPKLYIMRQCKNLIAEIQEYVWKESRDGQGNLKEEPRKVFDHAVDALRYVVMSRPDYWARAPKDRYGREIKEPSIDFVNPDINSEEADYMTGDGFLSEGVYEEF